MPYLVRVDDTHALAEVVRAASITARLRIDAMEDRDAHLPMQRQSAGRFTWREDALQWLLAEPAS